MGAADLEVFQEAQETVEYVQIRTLGGIIITIPAVDYAQRAIWNLSRGRSFGVLGAFGVDYKHQPLSLEVIPQALAQGIHKALEAAAVREFVEDILVDFKAAGASSLDYLIFLTVKSDLAPRLFQLERLIQRACVQVCIDNGWEIPFQQITLHPSSDALATLQGVSGQQIRVPLA